MGELTPEQRAAQHILDLSDKLEAERKVLASARESKVVLLRKLHEAEVRVARLEEAIRFALNSLNANSPTIAYQQLEDALMARAALAADSHPGEE